MMKTITALFLLFVAIAKSVVFDGWRALKDMLRLAHALLRRCLARLHLNHNEKARNPADCTPIKRPEFNRPDPLIYSQSFLMSLGFAVTWDNPDITLQKVVGPLDQNAPPDPALTVPSSSLEADTEYDVVARIWNGSTSAPVVGLGVKFTQHGFGIGVAQQAIGNATANLGVKGGAGCPAYARTRWKTPKKKGHYCLQVLLEWFDDLNPANNLGQENTNVGVAQSPAKFTFALGNQQRERQTFRFEPDTFAIDLPGICDVEGIRRRQEARERERRERESRNAPVTAGRPETFAAVAVPKEQTRASHPLTQGWTIDFAPEAPTLAPGEEMEVGVTITPPDSFSGRQLINVNAFDAFGPVGGVTFQVEKA
jgi:hypothetical protein